MCHKSWWIIVKWSNILSQFILQHCIWANWFQDYSSLELCQSSCISYLLSYYLAQSIMDSLVTWIFLVSNVLCQLEKQQFTKSRAVLVIFFKEVCDFTPLLIPVLQETIDFGSSTIFICILILSNSTASYWRVLAYCFTNVCP